MHRHLRLARARGSLTAPNHPVQDEALEILLVLDDLAQERQRLDMVRGLLVDPRAEFERVRAHFPEYFGPPDPEEAYEEALDEEGNFDIDAIDDEALDWTTPASLDDDEDISRWIAQHEHGSISAADL